MRYLSICSGIACETVAWRPLGWTPAAFAEIAPHANAVLAHHYPDVPNAGDFIDIKGNEYGPVDLLIGGTPCQSFSIGGFREGMGDDRGNLALEFCRLVDRTRPRWVVWENVPGALTANGGRDFGSITAALVQLGYSIAWRVLDAQGVRSHSHPRAVAQRRKRLFIVGHTGDDWRIPAAVLIEREGMREHAPSRRLPPTDDEILERASVAFESRKPGPSVVAPTLTQKIAMNHFTSIVVATKHDGAHMVRWLSPVEAERLQGLPDDYTNVPYKGKPMPKQARYVMVGNGIAVNVMRWLGDRIQLVEETIRS